MRTLGVEKLALMLTPAKARRAPLREKLQASKLNSPRPSRGPGRTRSVRGSIRTTDTRSTPCPRRLETIPSCGGEEAGAAGTTRTGADDAGPEAGTKQSDPHRRNEKRQPRHNHGYTGPPRSVPSMGEYAPLRLTWSAESSQFLALAGQREELAPSLRPEPPRPRLGREPPELRLELCEEMNSFFLYNALHE